MQSQSHDSRKLLNLIYYSDVVVDVPNASYYVILCECLRFSSKSKMPQQSRASSIIIMADALFEGDVLLLPQGIMGIVRSFHQNHRQISCAVELKGRSTETHGSTRPNTMEIRLNKNHQKHRTETISFRKLSGEDLFDKLSIVHDIINQDQIHSNYFKRLQYQTDALEMKLKHKEIEYLDLCDRIKDSKKYLLLQQSIWTLTHPKNIDKTSSPVLFLTFPTFTNSLELLENLSNRFFHLNTDDVKHGVEYQWQIQIKVVSLIQQWMRSYWIEDFLYDEEVLNALDEFSQRILEIYGDDQRYVTLR